MEDLLYEGLRSLSGEKGADCAEIGEGLMVVRLRSQRPHGHVIRGTR